MHLIISYLGLHLQRIRFFHNRKMKREHRWKTGTVPAAVISKKAFVFSYHCQWREGSKVEKVRRPAWSSYRVAFGEKGNFV